MKQRLEKYILTLFCTISFMLLYSCNDDISVDSIYITAAESTPILNFSARSNGDDIGITVSSSLVTKKDVEVHLSIDNSLVDGYNKNYSGSFKSLPEGTCSLSESKVVVINGSYRSDPVKLIVNDIEQINKGVNYLLPIRLTSKSSDYPALPGSDVLYVIINRTILMSVPKFNGNNYFKVNFKDNDISRLQNLESFTIEARVNLWEFPKYYGGNLMGIIGFPESETIEKSAWLFIDGTPDRVGGEGDIPAFMFGVKQWAVYAGKLGFTIEKDTWYHVAGVFTNNKLLLYLNGILFTEAEYKNKVSFTNSFYIGGAPGVQNGFYIKGAVSEARLWTRALSASELRNPLHQCFVEADSEGLEGYWRLDDESDTCKDYSGNGHTATKGGSGSIEWLKEVPCP